MRRGISNLGITLIVLILLIAEAGGAYYVIDSQRDTNNNLQSQIDGLKTLISEQSAATEIVEEETQEAESEQDAALKTYANTSYGYALQYPKSWTVKQANTLESATALVKDSNIQFYSGNTLKLSVIVESKAKTGEQTLSEYASDISPKDKATVSGKVKYTIGALEGYKELVTISDPVSEGLYYFSESESHFFNFLTQEKTQSADIKAVLASFQLS